MSNETGNVLITGGNGNLGRLVADQLLQRGQRVVKFDLPGTEPDQERENELVIAGDMRDSDKLEEIMSMYKPDTVYHLASLLSGSSENDLCAAWDINASASFKLMNLALKTGVNKFFFASTIATYGTVDRDPMPEDYEQWPQNMYGATKVAVERQGVYFKLNHGLDFRCLRFPLVVSPYAPRTAVTAFPSHAFRSAIKSEAFKFPVSANVGMSTIFLQDVVDSIVQYTAAEGSGLSRHVYNLHAYYLSAGMVVDAVLQRFPEFKYSYEIDENVEKLISCWPDVMDDSSARRDWNWNPAFNFTATANRMLELLAIEK